MSEETVVITGGGGFVGKWLIEELKREWLGARLVVWDRVTVPNSQVKTVEVDIVEPGSYKESLRKEQPVWVVHLAAVSGVRQAEENAGLARRVNVEGTRKLLEEIRSLSPNTKVLVASSADIYGLASSTPLPELSLDEARPANEYARSKWEMEKMIEEGFNDRVLRVRPFPHIGPGQSKGFVAADFASQIAAIEKDKLAFAEGSGRVRRKPVIKVGNLEARRDFTDVRDVVRAYRLLMEKGEMGSVYNIASGRARSIREILDVLLDLSEVEIGVETDKSLLRPLDVPILVGDAGKLKEETGWELKISFDRALREVIDFWRQSG